MTTMRRSATTHSDDNAIAIPDHDPGAGCAHALMHMGMGHALSTVPAMLHVSVQGNIASWKKKEGDVVAPGQILAEIETDKATIEWEAMEEGFIAKILKGDGSKDIPIGEAVAVLVEEEASVAAFKDYTGPSESCTISAWLPYGWVPWPWN